MADVSVYLFYGDDEAAKQSEVAAMQAKLGDPALAAANTTTFDMAPSLEALRGATQTVPFLSEHRLVVVRGLTKDLPPNTRAILIPFFEAIPASTQLVLVEPSLFDKKKKTKHWLLKWAEAAGPGVHVLAFDLPEGAEMVAWLQARGKELGGELRPQAAAALAQLIGSDKLAGEQELQKLLAYVGYARPIEAADVTAISLPSGEHGDFFALIDALGAGNRARAMQMLEALMQERDLIMLYFSLVGHFRLLLQTRELAQARKNDADIAKALGIHPYRAEKLAAQARRFSLEALEAIYKRLLDLDEQIKTGEIEPELAMETFVASLSAQAV
ncbi:MAG: DNA polymerase III subunit delta [Anaerolineales bacterium]